MVLTYLPGGSTGMHSFLQTQRIYVFYHPLKKEKDCSEIHAHFLFPVQALCLPMGRRNVASVCLESVLDPNTRTSERIPPKIRWPIYSLATKLAIFIQELFFTHSSSIKVFCHMFHGSVLPELWRYSNLSLQIMCLPDFAQHVSQVQ